MLLKELSVEDCLKAIYTSKKITSDLDDFIGSEVENVLREYLDGFTWSCVDFSFGIYNQNYIRVKDTQLFFEQAERMTEYADEEVRKQYDKCKKMVGYNLFGYEVEQLAEKIKTMICNELEWYENISYGLYCKKVNDDTKYILETFIDCNCLDDYQIDENGKISKVCYYN